MKLERGRAVAILGFNLFKLLWPMNGKGMQLNLVRKSESSPKFTQSELPKNSGVICSGRLYHHCRILTALATVA